MPFRYSPSNESIHSVPVHLYCTPVFRLVTYFVAVPGSVLASNTICHAVPSHSTISFSPATKSELSAFFQASGPSYPASPTLVLVLIAPSHNSLRPGVLAVVGLYFPGSIIKSIEPVLFLPDGLGKVVFVGIVSSSQSITN